MSPDGIELPVSPFSSAMGGFLREDSIPVGAVVGSNVDMAKSFGDHIKSELGAKIYRFDGQ